MIKAKPRELDSFLPLTAGTRVDSHIKPILYHNCWRWKANKYQYNYEQLKLCEWRNCEIAAVTYLLEEKGIYDK